MSVHNLELERLFKSICKKKPSDASMDRLRHHQDQNAIIDFLVNKLHVLISYVTTGDERCDSKFEWGIIHSCHLLGELKAEKAAIPLIEILDLAIDDYMSHIHNASIIALQGMGIAGLETAYQKYQRDLHNPEHARIWLYVLSDLGVKDPRIERALFDHLSDDPAAAVNLMGNYGAKDFIPIAEDYVRSLADSLNKKKIDPFVRGARFEDPLVEAYIDCRESLVLLKEGISVEDPEFDSKVEALDRELLNHADFSDYGKPRVGRNDPCPCGSGKKYKKCCGKD